MTRRRGVTVEVLDQDKLMAACRDNGLAVPAYTGNALLRSARGGAVVLSYEGTATTEERPGLAAVDTFNSMAWEYLPVEVVETCTTGETVDLAEHIRTFGSRLDVNHYAWYSWATTTGDAA